MSDWREDEFKAALSALTPLEQMGVLGAVAWRWLGRYVVRRRSWVVSDGHGIAPDVHLIGSGPCLLR